MASTAATKNVLVFIVECLLSPIDVAARKAARADFAPKSSVRFASAADQGA
jgi:hypothetical protein